MRFCCPNKGCETLDLLYDNFEKHLKHECVARKKPCKFEKPGCKVRLQEKDREEHERSCEFREVICPHCRQAYVFKQKEKHEKVDCS